MQPDCHTTQERFTDYLDGALPFAERAAVEAHVERCGGCRNALAMGRALVGALADVTAPELPVGYAERFAARLQAAPAPPAGAVRRRRPARTWALPALVAGWGRPLAGAAAGVLLVVLYLAGTGREAARVAVGPAAVPAALTTAGVHDPVHVAMGNDATVEIWFDADRPVDRVRFTIDLPAGLRLVSEGRVVDVTRLDWEGSLAAGRNVITVPVRGVTRGTWTVTASIQKGQGRKEQSVDLLVNGV